MATRTAALVGATGGAGTTRLTAECGALLAANDHDVVIFDAAFTTQGLAAYTPERIETDVTALVTEQHQLERALYDIGEELPGRLALCPAWTPFERLARAKTAGAATQLEEQIAAAALSFDVVLVDTPPVGDNPSIGAVNGTDRTVVVAPDTPRGRDGVALAHERIDDIGATVDSVVANRNSEGLLDSDVSVPEMEATAPGEFPASLPESEPFTPAIAAVCAQAVGIEPAVDIEEDGRFSGVLG